MRIDSRLKRLEHAHRASQPKAIVFTPEQQDRMRRIMKRRWERREESPATFAIMSQCMRDRGVDPTRPENWGIEEHAA